MAAGRGCRRSRRRTCCAAGSAPPSSAGAPSGAASPANASAAVRRMPLCVELSEAPCGGSASRGPSFAAERLYGVPSTVTTHLPLSWCRRSTSPTRPFNSGRATTECTRTRTPGAGVHSSTPAASGGAASAAGAGRLETGDRGESGTTTAATSKAESTRTASTEAGTSEPSGLRTSMAPFSPTLTTQHISSLNSTASPTSTCGVDLAGGSATAAVCTGALGTGTEACAAEVGTVDVDADAADVGVTSCVRGASAPPAGAAFAAVAAQGGTHEAMLAWVSAEVQGTILGTSHGSGEAWEAKGVNRADQGAGRNCEDHTLSVERGGQDGCVAALCPLAPPKAAPWLALTCNCDGLSEAKRCTSASGSTKPMALKLCVMSATTDAPRQIHLFDWGLY